MGSGMGHLSFGSDHWLPLQSFLCACVANMVLRDGAQSPKSDGSADSIACLLHQAAWMLKVSTERAFVNDGGPEAFPPML